jgi:hypothetical protein
VDRAELDHLFLALKGQQMCDRPVEGPLSQPCPDCAAKVGERCIITDPLFLKDSGMTHIRRCFTPEANRLVEAEYRKPE